MTTTTETYTVTLLVLMGDAMSDRMMHAADMFESFKALVDVNEGGRPRITEIALTLNREPTDLPKIVREMKTALEWCDKRVTALWVEGHPETLWVDPAIKVISSGYNWGKLSQWLAAQHLPVPETAKFQC